jgi:hypothetical protein
VAAVRQDLALAPFDDQSLPSELPAFPPSREATMSANIQAAGAQGVTRKP